MNLDPKNYNKIKLIWCLTNTTKRYIIDYMKMLENGYDKPIFVDDVGNNISYSQAIRKIRKENKLSTTEFGKTCGVSKRTVEKWELDTRNPSRAALLLMKKFISD